MGPHDKARRESRAIDLCLIVFGARFDEIAREAHGAEAAFAYAFAVLAAFLFVRLRQFGG